MIAPDLPTAIEKLRHLVETSDVVLPFTGAGISTECGIPDFRSPGGIWTRMAPIQFDDFVRSQEMRDEAWRRRFAMEEQFGGARPGRGHRALASLFARGKAPGVITQNIDNLHQASGIPHERVVELHGNTTYATCLDCSDRYELDWVRGNGSPHPGARPTAPAAATSRPRPCRSARRCPEEAMRRAEDLTRTCDLFLAIGSSLVVWPAAGFPLMAKRDGARLAIVNREPTDFDDIADLVVRDDIGAVLEPFIAA